MLLGLIFRRQIEERADRTGRYSFEGSQPPEPVYIDADRTRLEHVFANLLDNASEFEAIGLPEMNGYEVAGQLRQDPRTAKAQLIAVTGYGSEEDRRRAREAEFDPHLTKPVDPDCPKALLAKQ